MEKSGTEINGTITAPWRFEWICQRPAIGSRWWRGNFTLGLAIDSHPRYVNVILCLVWIELGVSWEKQGTST